MLIFSGVICAESRQLSEIATNFGRLCLLNFVGGSPFEICAHVITPASLHFTW